ncbi:unnamed protein product [Sphagnum balticum]
MQASGIITFCLAKEPHVAGTPKDFATAEYVFQKFHNYGLSAHHTDYDVLLSYPLHRSLILSAPAKEPIVLSLKGKPGLGDVCSSNPKVMPTFHSFFSLWKSQAGAVAVVIYSDPQDYAANYTQGVYPDSQWLPPSCTQRGSVYKGLGDPLTHGCPSTPNAERISLSDPHSLTLRLRCLPFHHCPYQLRMHCPYWPL